MYHIKSRVIAQTASLTMYNLGVHLRDVYGDFLGDKLAKYETTKMRTTQYALSMLSAQLVNAGLWPPTKKQMWIMGFNWQPIPTG